MEGKMQGYGAPMTPTRINATPAICPVCTGRQAVSALFYGDTGDQMVQDLDVLFQQVPCRSCSGTGVVWPPAPTHARGDLLVDGVVVASGFRPLFSAEMLASLDVVGAASRADSPLYQVPVPPMES